MTVLSKLYNAVLMPEWSFKYNCYEVSLRGWLRPILIESFYYFCSMRATNTNNRLSSARSATLGVRPVLIPVSR